MSFLQVGPFGIDWALADEAVDRLWDNGLFQGYPGSQVYESVDGVGYLMLACILV